MGKPRKILPLLALCLLISGQSCVRFSSPKAAGPTVLRSDDHGNSWTAKDFVRLEKSGRKQVTVSITGLAATDLQFSRANNELAVLSTSPSGLYLSTNRGEQWSRTTYPTVAVSFSLDPLDERVWYASSGNAIWKTADRGQNWQTVFTVTKAGELVTNVLADSFNPKRVVAATNTGVLYLSQDSGQTWTVLAALPDQLSALHASPSDSRVIFAVGVNEGLWKTSDGGKTWSSLKETLAAYAGASSNPTMTFAGPNRSVVYLTSDYGFLRSRNGGSQWERIRTLLPPPTPIHGAVVDPNDDRIITLYVGNKLHRTNDGGQSWNVIALPTNRPLAFLRIDPVDPNIFYLGAHFPPKK